METTTALAVLQSALDHCRDEDIRTYKVLAALDLLAAQSTDKWQWAFDQFRIAVFVNADSDGWEIEGRWQVLNAALNGIKGAVI